jgi:lipid-binding SYLF domain-containing protein
MLVYPQSKHCGIMTRWFTMRRIASLVGFICLLLAGCTPRQRQHATTSLPTSLPPASLKKTQAPIDSRNVWMSDLRDSVVLLQNLVAAPANAIPDVVLNRARCLVIVPIKKVGAAALVAQVDSRGIVTCRLKSTWSNPVVVNAQGINPTFVRSGDFTHLLLLVMSERARQDLLKGTIAFGSGMGAGSGPLVEQAPMMTDFDLKDPDAFAYISQRKKLQGTTLTSGVIQLDANETTAVYERDTDPKAVLGGAALNLAATSFFLGTVNSFFNAITPSGIIIHHSALIPASQLPAAEQELDRFHYRRGFSIYCFGQIYHIAYHYLILPNGMLKQGRPERCEGAHSRGYNSYLGIALMGDFSSEDNPRGAKGPPAPTPQQMRALLALCRQLRKSYNIPIQRVMRHGDVSTTRCPGDRFPFKEFLAQLQQDDTRPDGH